MTFKPVQVLTMGILLVCSVPAHAYIDPGTGTALIQGLVAAVAAIGVSLKLYWHRVVKFFSAKKTEEAPIAPNAESEDQS